MRLRMIIGAYNHVIVFLGTCSVRNLRSAPGYTRKSFDLVNPDRSACTYIWVIKRKSLQVITAHTDDDDSEILSPKRTRHNTAEEPETYTCKSIGHGYVGWMSFMRLRKRAGWRWW